jgi:hypothetical protein
MKSAALIVCVPLIALVATLALDKWHRAALQPGDNETGLQEPERAPFQPPIAMPAIEPSTRLTAGAAAPDLTLRTLSGETAGRLSDFQGRPVVLVFGSFSCNLFDQEAPGLERLYQAYKDRVIFLMVNIGEAGHPRPCLEEAFGPHRQTASSSGRAPAWVEVAKHQLRVTLPIYWVVEPAELTAYHPWPLRLVLIGADGRVARDAGLGIWQDWRLSQRARNSIVCSADPRHRLGLRRSAA